MILGNPGESSGNSQSRGYSTCTSSPSPLSTSTHGQLVFPCQQRIGPSLINLITHRLLEKTSKPPLFPLWFCPLTDLNVGNRSYQGKQEVIFRWPTPNFHSHHVPLGTNVAVLVKGSSSCNPFSMKSRSHFRYLSRSHLVAMRHINSQLIHRLSKHLL